MSSTLKFLSNNFNSNTFLLPRKNANICLTNYRPLNPTRTILIQHGLLASSKMFFSAPKERNLIAKLLEHNFSVWFHDIRGNVCSPCTDYSFDINDVSLDLVAASYFIAEKDSRKINFVGHSMGAYMFLDAASQEKNNFDKHYDNVLLVAPAVIMKNTTPVNKVMSFLSGYVPSTNLKILGKEGQGYSDKIPLSAYKMQLYLSRSDVIEFDDVDDEAVTDFFKVTPAGTSMNILNQIGQAIVRGEIAKYDYGTQKNFEKYGKALPPTVPFSKIKNSKIGLMSGGCDYYCHKSDVELLARKLGDNVKQRFHYDNLGHCSFFLSKDTKWQEEAINFLKSE